MSKFMFTLISKFWMLISISVIIFISGMMYANSSEGVPYSIPALKTVLSHSHGLKSDKVNPTLSQNLVAPYIAPYTSPKSQPITKPKPEALSSAAWIDAQAGSGACSAKPSSHWVFSKGNSVSGFQCLKASSIKGKSVYSCGPKQSTRRKKYFFQKGNSVFDTGSENRPYVTLTRVTRPSQVIALKKCIESDKNWSPYTILDDKS